VVKKYHLPVVLCVPLESSCLERITQESNPATLASVPYSERMNPHEEEPVLMSHFFSVRG